MEKKLTPWYPKKSKPARVGAYIVEGEGEHEPFLYWDGKLWLAILAYEVRSGKFDIDPLWKVENQKVRWRGLAEKP